MLAYDIKTYERFFWKFYKESFKKAVKGFFRANEHQRSEFLNYTRPPIPLMTVRMTSGASSWSRGSRPIRLKCGQPDLYSTITKSRYPFPRNTRN